jgi:hypothetical protein
MIAGGELPKRDLKNCTLKTVVFMIQSRNDCNFFPLE